MSTNVEIKCPYCYDWSEYSHDTFVKRTVFECSNCFRLFILNDTVIEYVRY